MYIQKPDNFSPRVTVVSCYLENNDKFLYLRYADHKLQGKWGVPAGKIKTDEDPVAALLREVYEETKIWLTAEDVSLVDKVFFREPEDYVYYIFKATLPKTLTDKVQISPEHQDYKWLSYQEVINLPLVFGARDALEHYIKATKKAERNKIVPSAYLILKKDNKFLLYLRQNSGFEDGNYGLVAGHIEYGESAKQAIIREAYEEANIIIAEKDLQFAHVSCRRSERENIDVFFKCKKWYGEIANNEPHKCAELKFFAINEFPKNVVKYIRKIITLSETNIKYSEIGWSKQELVELDVQEEFV